MIFGEYLGEVVSNGEYEIRANGTTLSELKAAVNILTKEEYLDSYMEVRENRLSQSGKYIYKPYIVDTDVNSQRLYQTAELNGTNILFSGTVLVTPTDCDVSAINKNLSNGALSVASYSVKEGTQTLTSWKLYVRKAVLAIPGEGNIAHIIAPVQKTLTAVKAYSKDDQFVYNDDLYKATTSIALGGTITIGTNAVRANSITEQMGNLLGSNGIYYNANTDITVATNRGMAIKYICDNMDKKIYIATYSIRYANGYYCMYVVNRILLGGTTRYVVIEYPITGQPSNVKICFWQYIPSTAPTTPDWTI